MMKNLFLTFLILFAGSASAFTLNTPTRASFDHNEITIQVASNDCANSGITAYELMDIIQEAVEMHWNKVPTSALKLQLGTLSAVDISTDNETTIFSKTEENTILAGCNSNTTDIFTDSGTIGKGGPGYVGDRIVKGVLILRDTATNGIASLDRKQLLAVIAHELGHAFGLGHSGDSTALMYYSLVGESGGKIQESLAMDDYDAVTYLYPNKAEAGGLLGSCGTLAFVDQRDHESNLPWTGVGSLFLGAIFVFLLIRILKVIYSIHSMRRSVIARTPF